MWQEFFSILILLLILLDPFGNTLVFLSLLKNQPKSIQKKIIIRENIIAAIALILFIFIGDKFLALLNLSQPALAISGGIILFLIALRMVFPVYIPDNEDYQTIPFIVPMAIPLIAGPAALTTILLLSKKTDVNILIITIVIAIIINILILLSANTIAKVFGKAGMNAMERLIGLILIAISVQMVLDGLKTAFKI